ncbi:MAG: PadR family transcriptional regulator [Cyclobacteriaceae bacterium]|nr:PadR family transcriptional regulator [Cyclobacteriaceae bacterium]
MNKSYLGEFEELILTIVGILQEEAYGNAIVTEIKHRVDRDVNLSAVHVTLYRLEDKGYVKSSMGGATNSRGGRRKRIFTITNAGIAVLRAMKESRTELWKLIPQLKISYGQG